MISRVVLLAVLLTVALSKTWDISVGQGGSRFVPNSLVIQPGDSVRFTWVSNIAHTLTESLAANSCTRDDDASGNGMVRQDTSTKNFEYVYTPTGTAPTFFFCEYHCNGGSGMVGSITVDTCVNPTPDVCQTYTPTVVGPGATCDPRQCQGTNGLIQRVCDESAGLECQSGQNGFSCVLVTEATIGQSCAGTNVQCVDGLYDIDCLGNDVCGNDGWLQPGEACTTATKPECDNTDCCNHGSCTSYPTSKCPSGFCCEFAATGETCDNSISCASSDYCTYNGGQTSGTCQTRLAAGSACDTYNDMCESGTVCVTNPSNDQSTCVEVFTALAGAPCNGLACAADLYCGNDGTCKQPLLKQGDACTTDSQCGPAPATCVCVEGTSSSSQECFFPGLWSNKAIQSFEAVVSCATNNGCLVDTNTDADLGDLVKNYFPGSCLETHCSSAVETASKIVQNTLSSGAGALLASALLAAAALALIL